MVTFVCHQAHHSINYSGAILTEGICLIDKQCLAHTGSKKFLDILFWTSYKTVDDVILFLFQKIFRGEESQIMQDSTQQSCYGSLSCSWRTFENECQVIVLDRFPFFPF